MPTSNRTHAAVVVAMIIGPVVLGSADVGQAAETLDIVYLANEGFLLRSGETAVLIDAVFGDGLFGYGILDASERQKLETAQPPYDSVDLVLASHSHGDHFNVPAMARFLAANPKTKLISTEHAVDKLLTYNADPVDRVLGVFPTEGQQVSVSQDGIDLTVFNLHHGRGSQTQNLGLLVEICGLTILHIGDTETSPEEMRVAGLEDLAPDVALLPSWYLRPRSSRSFDRGASSPCTYRPTKRPRATFGEASTVLRRSSGPSRRTSRAPSSH